MKQNPVMGFSSNWPQSGPARQHYSHHYKAGNFPETSEYDVDNTQPPLPLTGVQPGQNPPRGNSKHCYEFRPLLSVCK